MDLTKFEEHLRQTSGPRTASAYLSDARRFAAFLADRPVSLREVEAWIASMNHGTHRPQTLARKRAAVGRLLGFLAADGDRAAFEALTVLRFYRVVPKARQVDAREVKPISRSEFLALRERSSPRYRALFDVLWWTGARISETIGDPMTGIPPLSGADVRGMVERGYTETSGKGGKRRVLVLPPKGREALRAFAAGLDGEARVFPVTAQAVNATLHRLGFAGGAHAFRHSYRLRLRQAGVSPEMQARLMGHGPRNVTEGYGQAEITELLAAVEELT